MSIPDTILGWLDRRLEPAAAQWLREQCALLQSEPPPHRLFHLAFGRAARMAGRSPLAATAREREGASSVHPGWDLTDWTLDQAARAALLLSLPSGPESARAIAALFQTADLGEHVALVKSLFLLPEAGRHLHIAREGIRSNMGDVFRAISQRNPYPAEHFDDVAWNQMVTKCLFLDLPLRTIRGLDRRANPDLARMLLDLARERRAASRALSPEAWRCIAPFAGTERREEILSFLEPALEAGGAARRGAVLALLAVPEGWGEAVAAARAPELAGAARHGTLTWDNYDQA